MIQLIYIFIHSNTIIGLILFHSKQFLAWLSEAESLCENAEQEIERNPLILKVSSFKWFSSSSFQKKKKCEKWETKQEKAVSFVAIWI